jgi:hypothetical protein
MANFGNVKSASIGTTVVTLKTVNTPTLVTGCNFVNKSGASASISVYVTNSSTNYYIVKDKRVDGNSNFEAITGNKIVLVSGDVLKAVSTVDGAFDGLVSTLDGF